MFALFSPARRSPAAVVAGILTALACLLSVSVTAMIAPPRAAAADAMGHVITVDAVWHKNPQGGWTHNVVAGDPDCTIADAVKAANTNTAVAGCGAGSATGTDVIVVTTDQRIGAGTVSSAIRVEGHGHLLTTDGTTRIFALSGDDAALTLDDVVLAGGVVRAAKSEKGLGGAVSAGAGTTLDIDRSVVKDNKALGGTGGLDGVDDDGGFGRVCMAHVPDGSCGTDGYDGAAGGVAAGGAIYGKDATVVVTRSVITGNTAVGGSGGDGEDGTDGGDGLDGRCSGTVFDPSEHRFMPGDGGDGGDGGNGADGADGYGGAVAIDGGALTISQTAVTGNSVASGTGGSPGRGGTGGEGGGKGTCSGGGGADGVDGTDGTSSGTGGDAHGAISVAGDATATITASTVADNSADIPAPTDTASGSAGIANLGGDSEVTVENSTVVGNDLTLGAEPADYASPTIQGSVAFSSSIVGGPTVADDDGDGVELTCAGRTIVDEGHNVVDGEDADCISGSRKSTATYDADDYAALAAADAAYQLPGDVGTPAIVPASDSAAIGAGACAASDRDQRGAERGSGCDAGAYEVGGEPANTAPTVTAGLKDLDGIADGSTTIDLSTHFTDAETPDDLTYSAMVSDVVPGLAAASTKVDGHTLTVHFNDLQGSGTVTVIATDPDGLHVSSAFTVTVAYSDAQKPSGVDDHYLMAAGATSFSLWAAESIFMNDTHVAGRTVGTDLGDITVAEEPAHGTVTLNSYGGFYYTPDAAGTQKTQDDSFVYGYITVCQSPSGGAPFRCTVPLATVTLTVARPTATDDGYDAAENHTLKIPGGDGTGVLDNDVTVRDGMTLTATLKTKPAADEGKVSLGSDGGFEFTPATGFVGDAIFTYVATSADGAESAPGTVTISVAKQKAPVAVDDSYYVHPGTPLAHPAVGGLTANDTDAEGDALTPRLVTGPKHGTLVLEENGHGRATGGFTYTPDDTFAGSDSFTYLDNDGTADSMPATVTLKVVPEAVDDAFDVQYGHVLKVGPDRGVVANDDIDRDGTVTATVEEEPSHGTLKLNADGSFNYTGDTGYRGTDSFGYTLSDGHLTAGPATVTLSTVEADGNTAPTASADHYDGRQGVAVTNDASTSVLANDTDAQGDPLTVTAWGTPDHGTVVGSADGVFSYTPTGDFAGDDSFGYTVSDGYETAHGTVTVHVAAGPRAVDDRYVLKPGVPVMKIDAAHGVIRNDAVTTGVSAAVAHGPAHGTLDARADGSFDYTPDAGFHGVDSFTYHLVAAGGGRGDDATVLLSIPRETTANSAPRAVDDSYSIDAGQSLTRDAAEGVLHNDADADGDLLIVAHHSGTSHGGTLLMRYDGSFTYIPKDGFIGTDTFTYVVSDGTAESTRATVSVTIADPTAQEPGGAGSGGDGGSGNGSGSGSGGRGDGQSGSGTGPGSGSGADDAGGRGSGSGSGTSAVDSSGAHPGSAARAGSPAAAGGRSGTRGAARTHATDQGAVGAGAPHPDVGVAAGRSSDGVGDANGAVSDDVGTSGDATNGASDGTATSGDASQATGSGSSSTEPASQSAVGTIVGIGSVILVLLILLALLLVRLRRRGA